MQCSRIRLRAISRGIASNLTPRATNYLYRWYIRRLTLFFFFFTVIQIWNNFFFFKSCTEFEHYFVYLDAENNDFV